MASLKAHHLILLFLLPIFLFSSPTNGRIKTGDEEDDLLNSLNCHRAYLDLPIFEENDEASCLAEQVAKKLEDQTCDKTYTTPFTPDEKQISKCEINVTHAKKGVVLPVCVPHLELTMVFTNYTKTNFHKYINDSNYAQAGVGREGDWMVLVLGTNSTDGDFASAANALVSSLGFGHCMVSLLLGLFVYLVY